MPIVTAIVGTVADEIVMKNESLFTKIFDCSDQLLFHKKCAHRPILEKWEACDIINWKIVYNPFLCHIKAEFCRVLILLWNFILSLPK